MRYIMMGILLCLSGYASAHQWTPTYPKMTPSYVSGVLSTEMVLYNARNDVSYFELSVFDSEWNPTDFVVTNKIMHVQHLERKSVEIFINAKNKNRVTYICSKSKILSVEDQYLVRPSSRICSKIKSD